MTKILSSRRNKQLLKYFIAYTKFTEVVFSEIRRFQNFVFLVFLLGDLNEIST